MSSFDADLFPALAHLEDQALADEDIPDAGLELLARAYRILDDPACDGPTPTGGDKRRGLLSLLDRRLRLAHDCD